MPPQSLSCLRCKSVALIEVGSGSSQAAFFECPSCQRQYALEPGKSLTFRWLHPITLALYPVQFDEFPVSRSGWVANLLIQQRSTDELALAVREFRLELEDPTQRIRDTLDCRAAEGDLRQFLLSVTEAIEDYLRRKP